MSQHLICGPVVVERARGFNVYYEGSAHVGESVVTIMPEGVAYSATSEGFILVRHATAEETAYFESSR